METYEKREKGFYYVDHYHGYADIRDIFRFDIKPDSIYEKAANKVSFWCESTQKVFFTDGEDNWYLCNNNSQTENALLLQRINDGVPHPFVGFYRVYADDFFERVPFFKREVYGREVHEFGEFFSYAGPYESLEEAITETGVQRSDTPFEHGSHYYLQILASEPQDEQIFCFVDENKNVTVCTS